MAEYAVLGVDPASSKKTTLFDGVRFYERLPVELSRAVLRSADTLICWDAPLTGAPDDIHSFYDGDLCTRVIEKYFGGGKVKWTDLGRAAWRPSETVAAPTAPKGISVRGFSGLTHWTISRRVLGLPRVGPFDPDVEELPARLLTEATLCPPARDGRRPSVVEVHPAVALWLWLAETGRTETEWRYKQDLRVLGSVWSDLKGMLEPLASRYADLASAIAIADDVVGSSDDHLDAFVAWALGFLWTRQSPDEPAVVLFGNQRTGAMLVPYGERTRVDLGRLFDDLAADVLTCRRDGVG